MYKDYIKRAIDIIISILCIIVLIPIYITVGLLIKIIDKEKVLFMQKRTGLFGKEFEIYKFRTMKNHKVTKLGHFLRNTSIDELPQFFNVLKGDMSIVGPRPWIPDYYENFNDEQKKRVYVRPGLVGAAQVSGRRNINIFQKIKLDLEYVNNVRFVEDLKIVLRSFRTVINEESVIDVDDYIRKEIEALKNSNL